MNRPFWFLISMIALLMFFLAVLAGLIAVPARAECNTLEQVKVQVAKIFPQAKTSEIGGTELTAFMFGFNALAPPTAIIADHGLILQDPQRPKVAVILFTSGCFSATIFLSRQDFEKLMRTL